MPRSTPGVCPGTSIDWTGAEIGLSSHAKTTNEIETCFSITSHTKTKFQSVFQSDAKRETKFQSIFQSNAKTKNEIHICFVFQSDAKTKNEIRSSNPFFKVRRKRKTKSKIQICFAKSCENEKWTWNLNSIFPCHRKTVGTKVHALGQSERNFNSMLFTSNVAKSSDVILQIHVPSPLLTQYNVERSNELCLDGLNSVRGVGGGSRDVQC